MNTPIKYQNEYLEYQEKSLAAIYKEKLVSQEYEVFEEEYIIDDNIRITFDLVAKKGNKIIVYEFISRRDGKNNIKKINSLRKQALRKYGKNVDFEIVIVNPHNEIEIKVENIEIFIKQILNNKYIEELKRLEPLLDYVIFVNNVKINKLDLSAKNFVLFGEGYFVYNIKNNENNVKFTGPSDLYYFSFNIKLNKNLPLSEGLNIFQNLNKIELLNEVIQNNYFEYNFEFDL